MDELKARVEEIGGTVRRSIFDAGESITIDIPGEALKRFTSYWDEEPVIEKALQWVRSGEE